MGAGRGEQESMIVGETRVADFKGGLGAGEGDAPLLIDADAPEWRLASGLTTEYFALQGWHGLQFSNADGGVHHLELSQRVVLQLQWHTLDGPALKNRFGVFVREVNDPGDKIPNNGMPARFLVLFLRIFVGKEAWWAGGGRRRLERGRGLCRQAMLGGRIPGMRRSAPYQPGTVLWGWHTRWAGGECCGFGDPRS